MEHFSDLNNGLFRRFADKNTHIRVKIINICRFLRMGLDNFLLAADIDNFDPNVCVFSQTCGLIGRQGRIITYDLAKGRLKSIARHMYL